MELDHPRSDDSETGPGPNRSQDPGQPAGKSDIVCVHSGDVRAAGSVEPDIEGSPEPERYLVAQHA